MGWKKRLASRAVWVTGVVLVIWAFSQGVRQDVALVFHPDDGVALESLEFELIQDGEAVVGAEYRFPEGRERALHHEAKLLPGDYSLRTRARWLGVESPEVAWAQGLPLTVSEAHTLDIFLSEAGAHRLEARRR